MVTSTLVVANPTPQQGKVSGAFKLATFMYLENRGAIPIGRDQRRSKPQILNIVLLPTAQSCTSV